MSKASALKWSAYRLEYVDLLGTSSTTGIGTTLDPKVFAKRLNYFLGGAYLYVSKCAGADVVSKTH